MSGLRNGEPTHFCGFKTPGSWCLVSAALAKLLHTRSEGNLIFSGPKVVFIYVHSKGFILYLEGRLTPNRIWNGFPFSVFPTACNWTLQVGQALRGQTRRGSSFHQGS